MYPEYGCDLTILDYPDTLVKKEFIDDPDYFKRLKEGMIKAMQEQFGKGRGADKTSMVVVSDVIDVDFTDLNVEEKQEGLSPIPEYLEDPQSLAKQLFDFWIETMRSDKVDEISEDDSWEELPEEMRDHFVEAVQVNLTQPLRKFYEQLRLEAKCLEGLNGKQPDLKATPGTFRKPKGPSRPQACYVCAKNIVSNPGDVCDRCR